MIRYFLENRYQVLKINYIRSEKLVSLPCSIIQDSKLSSLLYNLYTNEITLLDKLMYTDMYKQITYISINNQSQIFHIK